MRIHPGFDHVSKDAADRIAESLMVVGKDGAAGCVDHAQALVTFTKDTVSVAFSCELKKFRDGNALMLMKTPAMTGEARTKRRQ
jgi:hypothetical protein